MKYPKGASLILFLITPFLLLAQGTNFFNDEETTTLPPRRVTTLPKPTTTLPLPQRAVRPKVEKLSTWDVILIMDNSGSMEASAYGQKENKITGAKSALSYFARNMLPGTRYQFWTFNSKITVHPNSPGFVPQVKTTATIKPIEFEAIGDSTSPVRQHFLNIIQGLKPDGGTILYETVVKAYQYFNSDAYRPPPAGPERNKIIVILSDGEDDKKTSSTLAHVLDSKEKNPKVQVKTIGFGIAPTEQQAKILCQMSTNNQCTTTNSAEQLKELFQSFTKS